MNASRLVPSMRQVLALVTIAAALAAAWLLFLREEGGAGQDGRERPRGVSKQSDNLTRSLGPRDLVDQVLLLGFEGSDPSAPIVAELREHQLGGVLVGAQNGAAPELVDAIASGAEDERIPPLITAAQEGGIYRSFPDLPPDARAIDVGDQAAVEVAQAWAAQTAKALRRVGFHLNLFPVSDVGTLDSPVGGRAFSDDAVLTALLTAAALRGCSEQELACAPLHFPGLGAASQDTAQGPATVSLDARGLAARDLLPFEAAIDSRVPAIVLSLAFYSAYDAVTPAALEPAIAERLLRERLGFTGVAITDDLSSGAIKATMEVSDAAVAALRAGADLVQISAPGDQDGVREAILDALSAGELPKARLREAASRVLELKRKLGLVGEV